MEPNHPHHLIPLSYYSCPLAPPVSFPPLSSPNFKPLISRMPHLDRLPDFLTLGNPHALPSPFLSKSSCISLEKSIQYKCLRFYSQGLSLVLRNSLLAAFPKGIQNSSLYSFYVSQFSCNYLWCLNPHLPSPPIHPTMGQVGSCPADFIFTIISKLFSSFQFSSYYQCPSSSPQGLCLAVSTDSALLLTIIQPCNHFNPVEKPSVSPLLATNWNIPHL